MKIVEPICGRPFCGTDSTL